MIRLKWAAMGLTACAFVGGTAFSQVVGDWTGNGTTNFNDGASWYQGIVPNGTIVMRFSPDFSTGPSGNNMSMNISGSTLGIDVESGAVSGAGNISITGANILTLGASGISMNQVNDTSFSIADITTPLELSANQTWAITNADLTVSNAITEVSAGTTLAIAGSGSINVMLTSGNSTYSGGTTFTGGAGAVLVIGASSTGAGGAPTRGPVGTGTLTLGSGVDLTTSAAGTYTLANDITVNAGTETIQGGPGGGIILTGTISGPGTIQAPISGNGTITLDGANTYTGGTILDYSNATIGNDRGLGTGPVSTFGNTITFSSNMPGFGVHSFNFDQSIVDFTMGGGEPTLDNLTIYSSTLNFAGASLISITDMTSDASGSTNVINLGNTSVLGLRIDGPVSYYGTITGTNSDITVTTGSTAALDLFGANTYNHGTTIDSNVLVIADNNSALGSGSISLNGGGASLGIGTGVTITNSIGTFSSGSNIEGYGSLAPSSASFLTVSHASVIVGGKGDLPAGGFASSSVPGTLTFGANTTLILGNSGVMQFSIMNATGTAGVDYSTISAPGSTVSISALATTPFTIQLVSVNPSSGQVGMANFNDTLSYSWTLLSAFSISGFAANEFTVDDTTDFQNATGGGTFSLSEVGGNTLKLTFTPVPEPSTWALMAAGLCALGAAVRRRRS